MMFFFVIFRMLKKFNFKVIGYGYRKSKPKSSG